MRQIWAFEKWAAANLFFCGLIVVFLGGSAPLSASHDVRVIDFHHYPHVNPDAPKGGGAPEFCGQL